jgi:hypothetical protein
MSFDLDSPPAAAEMAALSFALTNTEAFDKYIKLRVYGMHSHWAFKNVFPLEWVNGSEGPSRVNAVEFNPYVISKLRDAIAAANPNELWNPRISIHEMLSLARDPFAKDSSRLGAMKELNVMLNITVVDENGKTKAGRSLADFYNDVNAQAPAQTDGGETNPATSGPATEEGAK